MTRAQIHAKYGKRLYALTHMEVEEIIERGDAAEKEMEKIMTEMEDEGFRPKEVVDENGQTVGYTYEVLSPCDRAKCAERAIAAFLREKRPNLSLRFTETVRVGIALKGVAPEKRAAAAEWFAGYLAQFNIPNVAFDVEVQ